MDWALQSGVLDPNDGRDALSSLPADPEGPARAGTDNPKSLMGACSMPEPYCQPFRQMVSHAPVLEVNAVADKSSCYDCNRRDADLVCLLQCSCAIQCAVAIKTTVDIEHICDAFSAWNGSWVQGFD